jgi:ornithine cyclodeaminase
VNRQNTVLILGYDDVVAALPPAACIEVMAEVLAARARGEAFMPLRSVMAAPGANGFLGLMPAWRAGGDQSGEAAFALKAVCVMPENPARGLDSHQGTVTLFDGEIGVPTAILEASAVTAIRTAAVTAVATRTLAREDASTLAVIGAGVQARAHLGTLLLVRSFGEVRIFSRTSAHASALAESCGAREGRGALGESPGAPATPTITVADSAERAVRGADVIVTVTSSPTPVVSHAWLADGAHVNAVGASQPSSRELDVETVAASALFCDSRESLRNEAAEFRLAVEQGAIPGEAHVRAELGEVLAGTAPGRADDRELTVFRSLGIGVEDLAAAQYATEQARLLGIGTEVRL